MFIYPQGNVEDGAADFGKSLKIGSVARTALPAAQSSGDRVPILVDEFGRLIIGGGSMSGVQMVMGDIAHDAPDTLLSFPINTGLHAVDPTLLPADVTVDDRVRAIGSQKGEVLAYLSRLISGEDQTNTLLAISQKKVATGTYSPSVFLQIGTFGASGEASVKAAAGIVSSVYARNKSGAVRYLYLKNKSTAIAGGDAPNAVFIVPIDSAIIVGEDFLSAPGQTFTTAIRVGWSSTENTFTAVNEDVVVQVMYL